MHRKYAVRLRKLAKFHQKPSEKSKMHAKSMRNIFTSWNTSLTVESVCSRLLPLLCLNKQRTRWRTRRYQVKRNWIDLFDLSRYFNTISVHTDWNTGFHVSFIWFFSCIFLFFSVSFALCSLLLIVICAPMVNIPAANHRTTTVDNTAATIQSNKQQQQQHRQQKHQEQKLICQWH